MALINVNITSFNIVDITPEYLILFKCYLSKLYLSQALNLFSKALNLLSQTLNLLSKALTLFLQMSFKKSYMNSEILDCREY